MQLSPILGVVNVREAAEYFRDVLGFDLDPVYGVYTPSEDDPDGVYGIVRRDGLSIHFQIRRKGNPLENRGEMDRDVYIHVGDADAEYETLQRRGAVIREAIADQPYGMREFTIQCPNGLRISYGAEIN